MLSKLCTAFLKGSRLLEKKCSLKKRCQWSPLVQFSGSLWGKFREKNCIAATGWPSKFGILNIIPKASEASFSWLKITSWVRSVRWKLAWTPSHRIALLDSTAESSSSKAERRRVVVFGLAEGHWTRERLRAKATSLHRERSSTSCSVETLPLRLLWLLLPAIAKNLKSMNFKHNKDAYTHLQP